MIALLPCNACERHIRHHESICPFCGVPQGERAAPVLAPMKRVTRTAWIAVGATLAATGCSPPVGIAQPYGAPPQPQDAGEVVSAPMYGGPPPVPETPHDGGVTVLQPPETNVHPMYGMPPPH